MNAADEALADDLLERQIALFRFTAGEKASVLRILKTMEEELIERLTNGKPMSELARARRAKLLDEAQRVIAASYGDISAESIDGLSGLGQVEAAATAKAIGGVFVTLAPALPTEAYLAALVGRTLVDGAPMADWWRGQSEGIQSKYRRAMEQGLAAGETNAQLAARVRRDVMPVARNEAAALVQTGAASVASAARMKTFQQNGDIIKGYRQLSTLDSHTTFICVSYSGKEWNLNLEPINGNTLPFVNPKGASTGTPRHWNCRSLISPITKTFKEMGIDLPEFKPSTRAASGGPVSAGITFDQFLEKKGPKFADDLLGKGRADLWRDGKITLSQLLDQSGRPLTLDELRKKFE